MGDKKMGGGTKEAPTILFLLTFCDTECSSVRRKEKKLMRRHFWGGRGEREWELRVQNCKCAKNSLLANARDERERGGEITLHLIPRQGVSKKQQQTAVGSEVAN